MAKAVFMSLTDSHIMRVKYHLLFIIQTDPSPMRD